MSDSMSIKRKAQKAKVMRKRSESSLSSIKSRNEQALNNKYWQHWKKIFLESCKEVGSKTAKYRSIFPPKSLLTDSLLTKVLDHM